MVGGHPVTVAWRGAHVRLVECVWGSATHVVFYITSPAHMPSRLEQAPGRVSLPSPRLALHPHLPPVHPPFG